MSLYAKDQYVAGRVAQKSGDYAAAEKAARETLKEEPQFVDGYILLAESCLKQGNTLDGMEALNQAEALAPERPEPTLLKGMLYELLNNLPEAQKFYRRARDSYDTDNMTREQALQHATASYLAMGQLAGFQAVDKFLAEHPEDQEARVLRSQISEDHRPWFLSRITPEFPATETAEGAS